VLPIVDAESRNAISELAHLTLSKRKWVPLALALIVVALAVMYAHDSSRHPLSARLGVRNTVTAHTTPIGDLKAGNSNTPIPAAKAREEKAKYDNSIGPISTFSGIDESLVGQPFQISASIGEGCKNDLIECPLVMASVARMVKEPRDIDWAARMEKRLQAVADMQGAGRYVIRNLECRTSTCILEVEVRPGTFPRYDPAVTADLRPNALVTGSERDASGEVYIVELMDFARR
jgi:hypothetical protein